MVWSVSPSSKVTSFYCLPLSALCNTAHRHWTHVNACRLSCGGVSNMLLVLSISFHCYYNIWGCMCSTGPFQFRWLKGYIYSSCYYHNRIGSIHFSYCYHIFSVVAWLRCLLHHILSLIAYTFREKRDFVFIIIVQFRMSANSRIRFGLQIVFVCLYITPSHHHHCANLSKDIELIKWLSDTFHRVCNIKHILSVIHYMKCGAVCFQFNLLHCDDWENVYTLPYYHHQIGNMNPLFRVRSWKNGMRCMPLYILITGTWTIMKSPQCLLSLRPKITGPMARRLTSWMNKMRIGAYISIKMPIYIYMYIIFLEAIKYATGWYWQT